MTTRKAKEIARDLRRLAAKPTLRPQDVGLIAEALAKLLALLGADQ